MAVNDNLILICGKSASGKSACLQDLPDHAGVMYLNTESGKKLPFKNKFKKMTITDPLQVYSAFLKAEQMPEIHTIVVDSLTYMMQMFEMVHVKTAANTMEAWGLYGDFFVNLMQQYVAKSTKNVIFTAHVLDIISDGESETVVKVKGALMNNGIESWFSQIVMAKRMNLHRIEPYESALLTITEDDEDLGYKHVLQVRPTKETVGEKIRGPIGMWTRKESFIDSNITLVVDRITAHYSED